MRLPVVSVVIPTRNRADLVVRAAESVLSQSMGELELIVVDDGSTDDTARALTALRDQRLRLTALPAPRGAAGARNVGIDLARGDYLALLDSDDHWHPDKLAKQVELCRSVSRDDVVCYTQLWQVNQSSRRVLPRHGIEEGQTVASYLFENDGMMQTSSLFISSPLAKRVRFDLSLKRHQDYDFCMRLEAAGARFRFIEEPLVYWHVEDDRERVSASMDFEASMDWLASAGSGWSSKTRLGFLLREVMPRYSKTDDRRAYVAGLAARGAVHGMVSPRLALRMVARVPLPKRFRQGVRDTVRRTRPSRARGDSGS